MDAHVGMSWTRDTHGACVCRPAHSVFPQALASWPVCLLEGLWPSPLPRDPQPAAGAAPAAAEEKKENKKDDMGFGLFDYILRPPNRAFYVTFQKKKLTGKVAAQVLGSLPSTWETRGGHVDGRFL